MKTQTSLALLLVLVSLTMAAVSITGVAASNVSQTAERLNIVVQPVSHLSGCVQMSIVARGDGIPFLINVTYASTGKAMLNGTVQVHLANNKMLNARYTASHQIWAALYLVPWDHPTGPLDYYVTAQSIDGAEGFWRPIEPYGLITIVPANLHVEVSVLGGQASEPVYSTSVGDTIEISALVALPLPGQGYPTQLEHETPQVDGSGRALNATTASKVQAVIGQGTFNATTLKFSNYTASTITMSYDAGSTKWEGSYTFQQSDPLGPYEIAVVGADQSITPNVGYSLGPSVTLGTKNVGGIDTGLVYVVSVGMIIVGFVAGLVVISKFALPKH